MHGSHFAPWYSRHRVAIYLNWGVFWPESVQLHDSLICSKPNRMLQNSARIQQQEKRQQGCWQLHYDESQFIVDFISCHSWPLTNNYICTGSVVHEFIIACHYSSEGSCQMLAIEPSLSITQFWHATWCFKSKWTENHRAEKCCSTAICGVKLWSMVHFWLHTKQWYLKSRFQSSVK